LEINVPDERGSVDGLLEDLDGRSRRLAARNQGQEEGTGATNPRELSRLALNDIFGGVDGELLSHSELGDGEESSDGSE